MSAINDSHLRRNSSDRTGLIPAHSASQATSQFEEVAATYKKVLAAIQPAHSQPIVPILGNTGSGKSTVVNTLMGHPMIEVKDDDGFDPRIDCQAPTEQMSAKIGHTYVSETRIPMCYTIVPPTELAKPKLRPAIASNRKTDWSQDLLKQTASHNEFNAMEAEIRDLYRAQETLQVQINAQSSLETPILFWQDQFNNTVTTLQWHRFEYSGPPILRIEKEDRGLEYGYWSTEQHDYSGGTFSITYNTKLGAYPNANVQIWVKECDLPQTQAKLTQLRSEQKALDTTIQQKQREQRQLMQQQRSSLNSASTRPFQLADCPGFADTRSRLVEFEANLGTHFLFQNASEVLGILLAIPFDALRAEKAAGLRSIIKTLSDLVSDPTVVNGRIIFLLTKALPANPNVTTENALAFFSKLQKQSARDESKQRESKFLSLIIDQPENLIVFNPLDQDQSTKAVLRRLRTFKPIPSHHFDLILEADTRTHINDTIDGVAEMGHAFLDQVDHLSALLPESVRQFRTFRDRLHEFSQKKTSVTESNQELFDQKKKSYADLLKTIEAKESQFKQQQSELKRISSELVALNTDEEEEYWSGSFQCDVWFQEWHDFTYQGPKIKRIEKQRRGDDYDYWKDESEDKENGRYHIRYVTKPMCNANASVKIFVRKRDIPANQKQITRYQTLKNSISETIKHLTREKTSLDFKKQALDREIKQLAQKIRQKSLTKRSVDEWSSRYEHYLKVQKWRHFTQLMAQQRTLCNTSQEISDRKSQFNLVSQFHGDGIVNTARVQTFLQRYQNFLGI